MAWAKRQTVGSSGRKLVLLVLADYATYREDIEPEGSDGRHFAWAGQRTLARDAEMTDRSVRTHLDALETAGLIRRVAQGGDGGGRRADLVILPVDDDGPRPFPVDEPVDPSVDDNVDNATGRTFREGATGNPEQGNRKNGAGAPYIEPPKEPAELNKRGTRLPDNFEVTDSMRSWYRENIGQAVDGLMEHEKFLDYWRSRTGQIAVKRDWPAAWRNWMREAMQRAGRRASAPAAGTRPRFPTAQERSQMAREDFQKLALEAERWVEEHGGNPEDHKQVLAVMERMKAERKGSATRTHGMYSDGRVIDGEVAHSKEVTAGESQ
jgi:hypothetical protein